MTGSHRSLKGTGSLQLIRELNNKPGLLMVRLSVLFAKATNIYFPDVFTMGETVENTHLPLYCTFTVFFPILSLLL